MLMIHKMTPKAIYFIFNDVPQILLVADFPL